MIEAFDEVMGDAAGGRGLQGLAAQAEADAGLEDHQGHGRRGLRACCCAATNLLASDALVEVALGGQWIEPEKVEAGTGLLRAAVRPRRDQARAWARSRSRRSTRASAWGSVHWQYLEDMSKVTPYEGTPLKLKKTLYIKADTRTRARCWSRSRARSQVGDELVVRIELRVDRDMEYVHLKDQRGSGTEPVNVLSQYSTRTAWRYYESTRDTASHFFIDYLPKGTYVFEYAHPRPASGPVPDRHGRASSACTPPSSTATRRASSWTSGKERGTLGGCAAGLLVGRASPLA